MHKVKAQRSEELFLDNMLILQYHFPAVDLKMKTAELHR